jgi:hypothetical protein
MATNEIERVIGNEAYLRLCAAVGGCDYQIPTVAFSELGDALVEMIGRVAAKQLIEWGSGSRIYVPYSRAREIDQRRLTLIEMRARGMSAAEIAREYRYEGRYTERQVYAILAASSAEAVQDAQSTRLLSDAAL